MYEDHPELCQLGHSAIESAVKSSKRMVEKAIRTNNIADGEVCANFVCSNYIQKESSIRTKLRVIRDPSGAFLFNAI